MVHRLGQPVAALDRPSLALDFARYSALPPSLSFSRASTAWGFDFTEYAADIPRLSAKGLLIEGQRTNHVSDSTFSAADAGDGALPAGVSVIKNGTAAAVTVAKATVASGNTVDIRIAGAASFSNGFVNFLLMPPGSVTGISQSDKIAAAIDLALVAGDYDDADRLGFLLTERDSGGGFERTTDFTENLHLTPSLARYGGTLSVSDAHTVQAESALATSGWASSAVIDYTLRLRNPQVEVASFTSSPILTAGSALTRAADVASVPLGDWFNGSEGALLVEAEMYALSDGHLLSLCDGSTDNAVALTLDSSGNVRAVTQAGGSEQAVVGSGTVSAGSAFKAALSYDGNRLHCCLNGGPVSSSTATFPTMGALTRLGVGSAVSTAFIFGHIKRAAYWTDALTANRLRELTT